MNMNSNSIIVHMAPPESNVEDSVVYFEGLEGYFAISENGHVWIESAPADLYTRTKEFENGRGLMVVEWNDSHINDAVVRRLTPSELEHLAAGTLQLLSGWEYGGFNGRR